MQYYIASYLANMQPWYISYMVQLNALMLDIYIYIYIIKYGST